jgi:hypothetical protein
VRDQPRIILCEKLQLSAALSAPRVGSVIARALARAKEGLSGLATVRSVEVWQRSALTSKKRTKQFSVPGRGVNRLSDPVCFGASAWGGAAAP